METREITQELKWLVENAPQPSLERAETSRTVDSVGLIAGPCWFFLSQPDGITYMVSVQPVGGVE